MRAAAPLPAVADMTGLLGKPGLADKFLLRDRPEFQQQLATIFRKAQNHSGINEDVLRAIEPINIAGLGNPHLQNWYPADANDLFLGAAKLGATREEIAALLQRCGFTQTSPVN